MHGGCRRTAGPRSTDSSVVVPSTRGLGNDERGANSQAYLTLTRCLSDSDGDNLVICWREVKTLLHSCPATTYVRPPYETQPMSGQPTQLAKSRTKALPHA